MHLFLALLLTHPSPVPPPPSRFLDTARAQEDVLLRVLAINDLHGALEPQTWPWSGGRAVGGAPALKAWFDTLSRVCHCTTVRLDGGDEMQGTLLSNFGHGRALHLDRKSTRLNSSHGYISYAVFCLKKK